MSLYLLLQSAQLICIRTNSLTNQITAKILTNCNAAALLIIAEVIIRFTL